MGAFMDDVKVRKAGSSESPTGTEVTLVKILAPLDQGGEK